MGTTAAVMGQDVANIIVTAKIKQPPRKATIVPGEFCQPLIPETYAAVSGFTGVSNSG